MGKLHQTLTNAMDIIVKNIVTSWEFLGDFISDNQGIFTSIGWFLGLLLSAIILRFIILGVSLLRKHIKENFKNTNEFLQHLVKKDIQTTKRASIWFWNDLFSGWSRKEGIYAWFLIAVQIIVFIFNPDSVLGFITALSGTICVLLVAKRKMSNYLFGFIQTGVAFALGLQVFLIGETGENFFYFITQFWGIANWKKNMEEDQVITEKFSIKHWVITGSILLVGTLFLGFIFDYFDGTQAYADAFTLITAMVAQMLMLYRFKEQWLFWGILNCVSLIQWSIIANVSMVFLYIVLLINVTYGYVTWSKGIKNKEQNKVLA